MATTGARTSARLIATALCALGPASLAGAEDWARGEGLRFEGTFNRDPNAADHVYIDLGGARMRVDLSAFGPSGHLICEAALDERATAFGVMRDETLVVAPDFFTPTLEDAHGYVEFLAEGQTVLVRPAPRQPDVVRGAFSMAEPEFAFTVMRPSAESPAIDFATIQRGVDRFERGAVDPASRRAFVALGKLRNARGDFAFDVFGAAVLDPADRTREVYEAQVTGEVIPSPAGDRVLVTRTGLHVRLDGPALDDLPDHHEFTLFGTLTLDPDGRRGEFAVFSARPSP